MLKLKLVSHQPRLEQAIDEILVLLKHSFVYVIICKELFIWRKVKMVLSGEMLDVVLSRGKKSGGLKSWLEIDGNNLSFANDIFFLPLLTFYCVGNTESF